jgi:hypothetical protein
VARSGKNPTTAHLLCGGSYYHAAPSTGGYLVGATQSASKARWGRLCLPVVAILNSKIRPSPIDITVGGNRVHA